MFNVTTQERHNLLNFNNSEKQMLLHNFAVEKDKDRQFFDKFIER